MGDAAILLPHVRRDLLSPGKVLELEGPAEGLAPLLGRAGRIAKPVDVARLLPERRRQAAPQGAAEHQDAKNTRASWGQLSSAGLDSTAQMGENEV